MARKGSFGRSGTTQNLSVLVYQLLKEQMNSEMTNILTAYETNMRDGKYSSQFNGQNVDGDYVMNYMTSMLAGFPPGSTEYETLNSQLASFRQRYQKDVQDLVIESMNNGTQIDFGLLGPAFSNKGIAEVELSDVREWSQSEIATLIENGETTQADKIKGAVFIAGFNVENDGKVAAVNTEGMSRGAYNKWLQGQLQGALDAGYTKDSEAYRSILKLQAEAASNAKKEGETKAAEGIAKKVNGIKGDLNAKAQAILQKYAASGGINIDGINTLIGKTSSNFPYYEVLQTLAGQIGSTEGDYAGYYGDIMDAIDPATMSEFNSAVTTSQAQLIQIRDGGLSGLSDADRLSIGADIDREISSTKSYISQAGIPFAQGGGASALDSLYTDLSGAGVYFRNDGPIKNGLGGHPDAVFDAMKKFGQGMTSSKVEGYSLLKDLAAGNIPVNLIQGFGSDTIKDTNTDGVIDAGEWDAAFKAGLSPDTFAQIEEAAASKVASQIVPSVDGSPTISPQTLVGVVLGAHRSKYLLDNGGQVVMSSTGTVSISDANSPVGPFAQPALITVNGKTYGGLSEPMSITQVTGDGGNAEDWAAANTNMDIKVYRTGGPGDKNAGIYVQIAGKLNGPSGASPNGIILPYNDYKKWMRDVAGVDIDDRSFTMPNSQEPAAIRVLSTDKQTANNINLNEAFANITNPESPYFIGKSSSGKGAGIMNINENGVQALDYPGFITDPKNISSAIDSAFKNPTDIMAKATKYATERGGNVTQKDLIRAVYASIPGIPNTYNMDLQADKFGQYKGVGARVQSLFPDVKESGQNGFSFSFPNLGQLFAPIGMGGLGSDKPQNEINIPKEATDAIGNFLGNPGNFFSPVGVPMNKPADKKDDGGPLGFLGNVFRNVPDLFKPNNVVGGVGIGASTKPKPVTPATAKPIKPSPVGAVAPNQRPTTNGRGV
jgi:hypothetical protein